MNKLFLSRELYSVAYIKQAIEAFFELSEITLENIDDYFVCIFNSTKYETEITIKEFENYLIDLCNHLGMAR